MDFLSEKKKTGFLVNEWTALEELYHKKLWHQLTLKVLELVKRADVKQQPGLLGEMYEKFISEFEHRINSLSLVEICLAVVQTAPDASSAISFLEKLKEKVKSDELSVILIRTAIGAIYLEQKNFEETKKYVEELDIELSKIDGVTSVHSRYYELSSGYYRTIGSHAEYYKNALRYLGCVNYETMSEQERHERAYYLSLAAILGDGIYNFGELLMHPILNSLANTNDKWIVEFLYSFNKGDLAKFESMKPVWSQQPDLKAAEVKMRQKICLLSLMEMSFTRPANNKQLAFDDVAKKTKLPENEVELLVMRALSLGLVKGSIDQIDKKIFISWVQPRVLDLDQIKMMRLRLDAWSIEVNKMIGQIQTNLHEIL